MSSKTTLIQTSQPGTGTNVLENNSDSDIIARGRDKCPKNNADSDIIARDRDTCPQKQL